MEEQMGSSVVGKVVESLFGVIKTEIGYMWNCKQNVVKLKNEVEKLKDMKGRVQQQIDIAKSEGNNLIVGAEKWVVEAGQDISKAEVFLEKEANANKTCFKIGICGNWATLHHYGKKTATKMTPSLLEHQVCGKDFVTCVSVYTRAPGPLDVYENKDLDDIHTHNTALDDIIAAIEDESKQIIGIYGLGGVGKTTLAKEAVAKVKHLFADVAFTTVSQTVKAEDIKKDTENARKRIMDGDKILIILDDVWEKLDLQELCIPCGSKHTNCKILLTSRSESVCQKMNAQSKICVNSLSTKEAWILFKRVVGERLETDADLKAVAEEVVEECGGLPLLIQVVGSTLQNKSIGSWKSALSRLKKAAPSEIDPDIQKAFTRLKLSYDYLESEDAKSCFLLCSMFPEDEDILLEDLVYYMVGLEKFDDLENMEDARDRVQNAVNILTSSGLLLNVESRDPTTKMHDVVRDVALLIASEDKNKFLVKAGKGFSEWLPRSNGLESYRGISLMNNKISKLPDYEIHLPHLEIFLVNGNDELPMISDEFIGGIMEVKVLDMGLCRNTRLPQSLKLLTKLRILNLKGNKSLNEISLLGEMKELEILILNETGIKKIPQEIGQLVNLRVLEVIKCYLYYIAPGVISRLQKLEELCIDFISLSEGVYDSIVGVMKLSKLTYLKLNAPSFEDILDHGFNYAKLKGYVIQIGEYPTELIATRSDRYLFLSREHLRIPLPKWIKELIKGSRPIITLDGIENLNNIIPTLYKEGVNKLGDIRLEKCPNVSCLVDSKLPKGLDEYTSFTNLVNLSIYGCHKLERVFTVSIAQGLVNLMDLTIGFCNDLEEVIYGGGDDDDRGRGGEIEEIVVEQQQHDSSSFYSAENNNNIIIVLPSLVKIYFYYLPNLKRFFNSSGAGNGNCSFIRYPSLVDVKIQDCKSMKKWGLGIHETPILKSLNGRRVPILQDGPSPINVAVEEVWRRGWWH